MPISVEQIVATYDSRKAERGDLINRMLDISRHYNNQIVIPLPEIAKAEAPAVANFFAQGIDAYGMRIASVLPDIEVPNRRPGVKSAERLAATRRRAAYGFWEATDYKRVQRQRSRWLVGYGSAPVRIAPNKTTGQPHWYPRDPLASFPSDGERLDMTPENAVFEYPRTFGWLRRRYGNEINLSAIRVHDRGGRKEKPKDEERISLLEWCDADETVLVATGKGSLDAHTVRAEYGVGEATITYISGRGRAPDRWAVLLKRSRNKAGVCPVIVPGRITLGQPKGQFDDNIGLFQQMAMLQAMEVSAIAEAIWPDIWFVHDTPGSGSIIRTADGRRGEIGEAEGGQFTPVQIQPGIQTNTQIDRLERNMRIQSGITPDIGGESGSNIRTGRRGDQILSAAMDFPIQEAQETFATAGKYELAVAAAVDEAYFGSKQKSFYVSWPKAKGHLDYTPKKLWTEKDFLVSYAFAGADAARLNVEIGAMIQQEVISKETARRKHPYVEDPDFEEGQIIAESLDRAILAAMQTQANDGSLPLMDVALIKKYVRDGCEIDEAVLKAQEAAQQRQATPVPEGDPAAMPGLSMPGMGAEAPPSVAPPEPSFQNMIQSLRGLTTMRRAAGG